jgi:hypothetical protein
VRSSSLCDVEWQFGQNASATDAAAVRQPLYDEGCSTTTPRNSECPLEILRLLCVSAGLSGPPEKGRVLQELESV